MNDKVIRLIPPQSLKASEHHKVSMAVIIPFPTPAYRALEVLRDREGLALRAPQREATSVWEAALARAQVRSAKLRLSSLGGVYDRSPS